MTCSPPESKRGSQRQCYLRFRDPGGFQAPDSQSPKPLCLVLYGTRRDVGEPGVVTRVLSVEPSALNQSMLLSESRCCGTAVAGLPADDSDEAGQESRQRGNHTDA